MATLQSSTLRNNTANGTFGNLNKAIGVADLAAAPIATVVEVLRLEAGTTVTGLDVFHGALGATTSLTVGVSFYDTAHGTDDADAFATVADTSASGKASYAGVPLVFEYPVKITVTVGGAAATGKVTVVPEYIYVGAK